MIDYENALQEFRKYLSGYDIADGKIRLKVIHTYKVAALSERIAKALSLSEEEVELAKLIGLLHDIGRFEQVRRYHTFVDGKSVNHAMLGVEILQKDNLIAHFCPAEYQKTVLTAIANHNRYRIEDGLDEKTLTQCKIIRDADKTDIFRVRIEDPIEDALPCDVETIENSLISDEVFQSFMAGQEISKQNVHTMMDIWIMGLAFIYDYNYSVALKILEENQYIDRQINRLHYRNETVRMQMEEVRQKAHAYIQDRLKEGN